MKIALILASIRVGRQSDKPALFAKAKLAAAGHEVDFLDLLDLDLPLYNESPEQAQHVGVRRLITNIIAADGIMIVTPEYNHTMSTPLKNALDYLRKREFLHKPIGLVGVSSGAVAGARAIFVLRGSLPTQGAILMPTVVSVGRVETTFPTAEICTDARIESTLDTLINELQAYAPALAEVRAKLLAAS